MFHPGTDLPNFFLFLYSVFHTSVQTYIHIRHTTQIHANTHMHADMHMCMHILCTCTHTTAVTHTHTHTLTTGQTNTYLKHSSSSATTTRYSDTETLRKIHIQAHWYTNIHIQAHWYTSATQYTHTDLTPDIPELPLFWCSSELRWRQALLLIPGRNHHASYRLTSPGKMSMSVFTYSVLHLLPIWKKHAQLTCKEKGKKHTFHLLISSGKTW